MTDEGSIRLAPLTVRLLNGTGGCLKWAAPLPSVPNTGPTLGPGVGSLVSQPAVSQQVKQSVNREAHHSLYIRPVTCLFIFFSLYRAG